LRKYGHISLGEKTSSQVHSLSYVNVMVTVFNSRYMLIRQVDLTNFR